MTTTGSDIPDDWFEATARETFELAFLPASRQPNLRYLQIGAFTGNASVWLLENVLTNPSSVLVDVDTWDGGDSPELQHIDFAEVERIYNARTMVHRERLIKCKMSSMQFFADHIHNSHKPFDFIYIDGDHSVISTIEDAIMAYRCLKPMGMMCFDDYTWQSKFGVYGEPTMAIDLFKILYAERMRVLRVGSQCWMQRIDAEVRR